MVSKVYICVVYLTWISSFVVDSITIGIQGTPRVGSSLTFTCHNPAETGIAFVRGLSTLLTCSGTTSNLCVPPAPSGLTYSTDVTTNTFAFTVQSLLSTIDCTSFTCADSTNTTIQGVYSLALIYEADFSSALIPSEPVGTTGNISISTAGCIFPTTKTALKIDWYYIYNDEMKPYDLSSKTTYWETIVGSCQPACGGASSTVKMTYYFEEESGANTIDVKFFVEVSHDGTSDKLNWTSTSQYKIIEVTSTTAPTSTTVPVGSTQPAPIGGDDCECKTFDIVCIVTVVLAFIFFIAFVVVYVLVEKKTILEDETVGLRKKILLVFGFIVIIVNLALFIVMIVFATKNNSTHTPAFCCASDKAGVAVDVVVLVLSIILEVWILVKYPAFGDDDRHCNSKEMHLTRSPMGGAITTTALRGGPTTSSAPRPNQGKTSGKKGGKEDKKPTSPVLPQPTHGNHGPSSPPPDRETSIKSGKKRRKKKRQSLRHDSEVSRKDVLPSIVPYNTGHTAEPNVSGGKVQKRAQPPIPSTGMTRGISANFDDPNSLPSLGKKKLPSLEPIDDAVEEKPKKKKKKKKKTEEGGVRARSSGGAVEYEQE